VFDNADGTYTATYTALIAGQYRVLATLGTQAGGTTGDQVEMLYEGSTIAPTLSVVHASLHAPTSTATGSGLADAVSGEAASVVVQARDAFGNLVNGDGDGDGMSAGFVARLFSPSGTQVDEYFPPFAGFTPDPRIILAGTIRR